MYGMLSENFARKNSSHTAPGDETAHYLYSALWLEAGSK